MSIRLKIILIVLPLMITTLLLTGVSSFFSATNAITGIAQEFLGFKAAELQKYAESQWLLLVENNFTEKPTMLAATQTAIVNYANSIIRSETEIIFALDETGQVIVSTKDFTIEEEEQDALQTLIDEKSIALITPRIGNINRVAKGFYFAPFEWYLMVTEERDTFYNKVNQISQRTVIMLIGSTIVAIILLLVFVRYLTNPLTTVVNAMQSIITDNDMSRRVAVEFHDEIGKLAHTFNLMVGELERAYNQIKSFAFKAVLAQKREHKIRNIFQKYVPEDVIDQFFENPDSMLTGRNEVLSILFSDIRSFTSISEQMQPDDLVNSLNRYFSFMVDIIIQRKGVIDKYIGDAIMAFFGAPAKHEDDALQSVLAGIEMGEALRLFNEHQRGIGKPEFRIGVGINYGVVTVGNIGTEKKMDYTIIGDMVNLASRMEGLTKEYRQELLISESLHYKVKDQLPCRLLDSVAVKGKSKGVKIYTAKKQLQPQEKEAWDLHNAAMEHYYAREFPEAINQFQQVLRIFPKDFNADELLKRCQEYQQNPPPKDWDGVKIMTTK